MDLRRNSDVEITALIERVEALDQEVKRLRSDFDDHSKSEEIKIELLNANLVSIQVKLDQLLLDIKEPMETYKAAKAGASAMKFIAEVAKWAVPLITGIWIGFGGLNPAEPAKVPAKIEVVK